MKNSTIKKIIMGSLALHLLYSNGSLLIKLNTIPETGIKYLLIILLSIFAVSYSILTVFIIFKFPKRIFFIGVGILDGFGIFLKLNSLIDDTAFMLLAALYFSIYTTIIVITSGFISEKGDNEEVKEVKEVIDYSKMNIIKLLDLRKVYQNKANRLQDADKKELCMAEVNKIDNAITNKQY